MRNLVEGIHRFQNQVFEEHRELFENLSRGQTPSTLFITCSDSRLDPSLVTQTRPGEMFVLRNAGNIIPPYGASNGGESPTIEYAVAVLKVEHIVVCGHSGCGAMQALLKPESVARYPAISGWLSQAEATRRIVSENYGSLADDAQLNVAVQENVLVQVENLETHPAVRARLGRGELTLHAWVYKIETGQVFAFSADVGQFIPLSEVLDPKTPKPRARGSRATSIGLARLNGNAGNPAKRASRSRSGPLK